MKLIKNYLYNVAYQLFALIVPLLTVPYISRVLGPGGVGINSFTGAVSSYFVLFGTLGINLYGQRQIAYARENVRQRNVVFTEILGLHFALMSIATVTYLLFVLFSSDYTAYYWIQLITLFSAFLDVSWFFMGLEEFKKTVLRNFFVRIVSLVAIFIFVRNHSDVGLYIFILAMAGFLGNLSLWSYLFKEKVFSTIRWQDLKIWRHFKPTFALFLPQVAMQIYLLLNRVVIGWFSSMTQVGFFDNSDKIVKMVLGIVTAIGTVMLPRIANVFKKGDSEQLEKYMRASFDFATALSVPITIGLIVIAKPFSAVFLGAKFAGVDQIIAILALVIIPISWTTVLGTQFLLAVDRTSQFTKSVLVGAIVNIVLNFIFIPFFAARGAAISSTVAEYVVLGIQLYFVRNDAFARTIFTDFWKYLVGGLTIVPIAYGIYSLHLSDMMQILSVSVLAGIFYLIVIWFLKVNLRQTITSGIRNRFIRR